MKKIIKDRINHLNSELVMANSQKMDKANREDAILDLKIRLDELNWILKKIEKYEF